ncbi:hypothetical protein GCM10009661_17360 [Catellatospora chokoriensis]|uniref:Uncharacterized protein n=1 Tax=Catellatospora chokoriensis TaxID=310353 RepID=A0A8J3JTR5_9ACTN|nr:hypothetical protein Cch02nite_00620 [Catellatospora chokoriensis]
MFVDRTGRRRRLFTVLAAGGGVALTLMLGIVVAGFLGVEGAGLPGLPQLLPDRPAAEDSPSPAPAASTPEPRPQPLTGPSASPTKTTGKPSEAATPSSSARGNRPTDRPHPTASKKK